MVIPYARAAAISKSETVDIPTGLTNAIYVGGAGIVAVVFQSGDEVQFTCTAGQILPVKAKRVGSTNTTATLMNALYW